MRKVRFSLRVLILLVTAVGLFLGYSQRRRHMLLRECEAFEQYGATISVPSDFVDYIWQRRPNSADIHFPARPWGRNSIEVTTRGIENLHQNLDAFGIDTVHHYADVAGEKSARPMKYQDEEFRDSQTKE